MTIFYLCFENNFLAFNKLFYDFMNESSEISIMSDSDESDNTFKYISLPNSRNITLYKYFKFRSNDGKKIDELNKKYVYCQISTCVKNKLRYCGNTTNLVRHLSMSHSQEYATYMQEKNAKTEKPSVKPNDISKWVTNSSSKKWQNNDPRAVNIHEKIVWLIVNDMKSFHSIEQIGFKNLMEAANPNYQLLSRHYYVQLTRDFYAKTLASLRKTLSDVEFCSITTDAWTSIQRRSFIAFTIHYINKEWDINSRSIEVVEEANHTALNLARLLKSVLIDFNIVDSDQFKHSDEAQEEVELVENVRIVAVSTDNAHNIVKSISFLKPKYHIPCLGHSINLAVKEGFKGTIAKKLLEKSKDIISHFHKSYKSAYDLRESQIEFYQENEIESFEVYELIS